MLLGRQPQLRLFVVFGAALVLPSALEAQTPACGDDEHRQFDFWIGSWRVETPTGQLAGYNTIERTHDCYLHESYVTPTGYAPGRASTSTTRLEASGINPGSTTRDYYFAWTAGSWAKRWSCRGQG
jgi:hypothetical protein